MKNIKKILIMTKKIFKKSKWKKNLKLMKNINYLMKII